MAVQSTIWFGYGVATDNVTVMLPNAVGLVLGTGYTWVFHQHYKVGPKKALLQQYAVAASILVFVCAGVWVLPPPRSTSFLGFVAASGSVIFAFSPLAAVVTVFRQQSVASMPLKTSCILFCNGSLWTLYGTLVAQDPAIWVPNVLGTFGGSLQLVIHAFFALRSTTTHRATYDTLNTDTDASSPRGFASVIDTTLRRGGGCRGGREMMLGWRACLCIAAAFASLLACLVTCARGWLTALYYTALSQGRYAQVVVGPAGSGKSTFCFTMQNYMASLAYRLQPLVVNLDPGQERSEEEEKKHPFDLDVRDLISVSDVLEELDFGPNGALVFAMEHLVENMEWLKEGMDEIGGSDDEYFIFDCPGQIELYTHIPVLRTVVENLMSWNIHVCVVHVIDALFIDDTAKFISGSLLALTAMMQLKAPSINVITKCDVKKESFGGGRKRKQRARPLPLALTKRLAETESGESEEGEKSGGSVEAMFRALDLQERQANRAAAGGGNDELEQEKGEEDGVDSDSDGSERGAFLDVDDPEYFNPDSVSLKASLEDSSMSPKFRALSDSICDLLDSYNLVHFLPLDITSEDSVELVVLHIDNATQYGEDLEPRDPRDQDDAEDDEAANVFLNPGP
ncbi:GPN-loop GTPase 3 [Durusdinium trenchii]|uniref:GPN-loop GTPase 3 n=1 Tax=Durusdinium trenchii TaxID=1381693 RepID=A0ABP0II98_9DINO